MRRLIKRIFAIVLIHGASKPIFSLATHAQINIPLNLVKSTEIKLYLLYHNLF